MMRIRIIAALAPLLALTALTSPAHADPCNPDEYDYDAYVCDGSTYYDDVAPQILSITVTPSTAVTYGTGGTRLNVTVKVSDDQYDNVMGVDVELESAGLADWEWPTMSHVGTSSSNVETWQGLVYVDKYSDTGKWYSHVASYDSDYNSAQMEYASTFYVKRNTALTNNASPEPVRYNGTVKVAGNLKRLDLYNGYVNYGGTLCVRLS